MHHIIRQVSHADMTRLTWQATCMRAFPPSLPRWSHARPRHLVALTTSTKKRSPSVCVRECLRACTCFARAPHVSRPHALLHAGLGLPGLWASVRVWCACAAVDLTW